MEISKSRPELVNSWIRSYAFPIYNFGDAIFILILLVIFIIFQYYSTNYLVQLAPICAIIGALSSLSRSSPATMHINRDSRNCVREILIKGGWKEIEDFVFSIKSPLSPWEKNIVTFINIDGKEVISGPIYTLHHIAKILYRSSSK